MDDLATGKMITLKEVAEATGAAYSTVAAYAQKAGWTENGRQTLLDERQVAIIMEAMKQAHGGGQGGGAFQTSLEGMETAQSRAVRLAMDDRNIPYREYQDRGYFRVVEQQWTDKEGDTHINLKTLAHQPGVDFIRKLIREAA